MRVFADRGVPELFAVEVQAVDARFAEEDVETFAVRDRRAVLRCPVKGAGVEPVEPFATRDVRLQIGAGEYRGQRVLRWWQPCSGV